MVRIKQMCAAHMVINNRFDSIRFGREASPIQAEKRRSIPRWGETTLTFCAETYRIVGDVSYCHTVIFHALLHTAMLMYQSRERREEARR